MKKDFIYLASASPRRRALLEQIGVPFRVRTQTLNEQRRDAEEPGDYVTRLAEGKASHVWNAIEQEDPRPVLAADTAVVVDEQVFGKPEDARVAEEILAELSGRTHQVLTAVALKHGERMLSRLSMSDVRFRATTARERQAYCATEEPLDKAGGYAIQGLGAVFVEHLSGSYSGVMGLPLCETASLLQEFGLPAWLVVRESRL